MLGIFRATVTNARAYLSLQEEGLSFSQFLWDFVDESTRQNQWTALDQLPAQTPESRAMSKALKQRGFSCCGPTISPVNFVMYRGPNRSREPVTGFDRLLRLSARSSLRRFPVSPHR
ncbi:MAG: hypothetical protein HN348_06455 [Proteobacteria bacterium]|nr:hypothetical protein [Pseudomonadota bacterium]